jgi:hypothetical protein
MRNHLTLLCNVIVPGSGLVICRREWLGLAIAMLFAILANVAILGIAVLPAAIPPWVTGTCLGAAVIVWLGSQWQLLVRMRVVARPGLEDELRDLRQRAAESTRTKDYPKAIALLRIALTLNDEDLQTNVQWAELMTLMGKFNEAERAWRRVQTLDRHRQFDRAAKEALASLPCT